MTVSASNCRRTTSIARGSSIGIGDGRGAGPAARGCRRRARPDRGVPADAAPRSARIVRGSGDDAAVVRARCVRGDLGRRDGRRRALPPRPPGAAAADAGHRALAAALSDLAAMGADPGEAYVASACPTPRRRGGTRLRACGWRSSRSAGATTIAGGDLVRAPVLTLAVTATGWADTREELVGSRRRAARRRRRRDRRARRRGRRAWRCSTAARDGGAGLSCAPTCGPSHGWPKAARWGAPGRHRDDRPLRRPGHRRAPPRRSAAAWRSTIDLDALPLAPGVADVAAQLGVDAVGAGGDRRRGLRAVRVPGRRARPGTDARGRGRRGRAGGRASARAARRAT